MNQHPAVYRVGNVTVTKIPEVELTSFKLRTLLPELTETDLERLRSINPTDVLIPADETAILSVHTWLVRTPKHTILVDTGIGNHKHRPTAPIFHQLQSSYLDGLSAAGVETDMVDYVLLTHIHADHVGCRITSLRFKGYPQTRTPNAVILVPQDYRPQICRCSMTSRDSSSMLLATSEQHFVHVESNPPPRFAVHECL
jgi:hypothetical protein